MLPAALAIMHTRAAQAADDTAATDVAKDVFNRLLGSPIKINRMTVMTDEGILREPIESIDITLAGWVFLAVFARSRYRKNIAEARLWLTERLRGEDDAEADLLQGDDDGAEQSPRDDEQR